MAPIYFIHEDADRFILEDSSPFVFEEAAPSTDWFGSGDATFITLMSAGGDLQRRSGIAILAGGSLTGDGVIVRNSRVESRLQSLMRNTGAVIRSSQWETGAGSSMVGTGRVIRRSEGTFSLRTKLEAKGETLSNIAGEIYLHTAGIDNSPYSLTLHSHGYESMSELIELSAMGYLPANSMIDLTLPSYDLESKDLSLYAVGSLSNSGEIPLHTIGHGKEVKSLTLHTKGIIPVTSSQSVNLWTGGTTNEVAISGALPLYTRAALNDSVSRTLHLVVGEASGPRGILNLYSSGFDPAFNAVLNLYAGGFAPSLSSVLDMYAHNIGAEGLLTLFTQGLSQKIGSTFEDSDGWIPDSSNLNLFIRRPLSSLLPLVCFNNSASGIIPLFALGGVAADAELLLSAPYTEDEIQKIIYLFTRGY